MKEKTKHSEWQYLEDERGFNSPLSDPPQEFIDWWAGHDHCSHPIKSREGRTGYSSGISARKAWQVRHYKREFEARRLEHASGTGLNYTYYGWHKPKPKPIIGDPKTFVEHQEWCRQHNKPIPGDTIMPELMSKVSSFADSKDLLESLGNKMDMNKAIGWTEKDSLALAEPVPKAGELPTR